MLYSKNRRNENMVYGEGENMQQLKGIIGGIRFIDEKLSFKNFSNLNNKSSSDVVKRKINESPECFILIVYKGKLYYDDGIKDNLVLNQNEVIFYKPLERVNIRTVPNEYAEFCTISFSAKVFSDDEESLLRIFNYEKGKNVIRLDEIDNGKIILNLFEGTKKYSDLNLKISHFIAILKMILSELCIAYDKDAPKIAEKYSQEYDSKIYSYITRNFNKDYSIYDISNKFYVSPSYINKICKRFYSMPYRQMIIDIKMWYARSLISKIPDIKLNRVANMCGYNEYSAFYKAYLNYFGIKPKDDCRLFEETGSFYNKFVEDKEIGAK